MRVGSVAFLVVLAGAAATMPQRLSAVRAALSAEAGGAPAAERSASELVERQAGRPGDPSPDIGALVAGAADGRVPDSGVSTVKVHNPLIDALLTGEVPEHPLQAALAGLPRAAPGRGAAAPPRGAPWRPTPAHLALAGAAALLAPAAGLTLALLLAIVDLKGQARMLVELCHWAAGQWLLLLSCGAPALRWLYGLDVWGMLPRELWAAPAVSLVVSAAFWRALDMNAPVWNRTWTRLAAPVFSGFAVPALPR